MNINWYPGHMAKAKTLIAENLKLVDIVIELLDARIPISSTNPDFQDMFKNKTRMVIFNKVDCADPIKTDDWIKYYKKLNLKIATMNALNNKDVITVKREIFALADERRKAIKKSKGINKTIRAMVVGIPNVGKSTLINSIIGSNKAKTGNKPGVTKGKQWVKVNTYFELLDTPGLLWPKLENEETALNLAYTGSIREEILDSEELTLHFLEDMKKLYPDMLINRYNLDDINYNSYDLLQLICQNRGWLTSGSEPDINRGAKQVLAEYRSGLLGKTTLELPL